MENMAMIFIGLICVALGISNMRGNISSLHSYHRNRVSEEDRIPFGRMVGLGTILCGSGLAIGGGLALLAQAAQMPIFDWIGKVLLIVGLLIGLGLSFYAMIKYNKGIF